MGSSIARSLGDLWWVAAQPLGRQLINSSVNLKVTWEVLKLNITQADLSFQFVVICLIGTFCSDMFRRFSVRCATLHLRQCIAGTAVASRKAA